MRDHFLIHTHIVMMAVLRCHEIYQLSVYHIVGGSSTLRSVMMWILNPEGSPLWRMTNIALLLRIVVLLLWLLQLLHHQHHLLLLRAWVIMTLVCVPYHLINFTRWWLLLWLWRNVGFWRSRKRWIARLPLFLLCWSCVNVIRWSAVLRASASL